MRGFQRRATPRVVNGKVQRKNRSAETPTYYNSWFDQTVLDRRRPGAGYRHILKKDDLARFIRCLPDWKELSVGLNAIVLAPGRAHVDGWHRPGIVAVCAWAINLWQEWNLTGYEQHRSLLERLGVPCEDVDSGFVVCKFEPSTTRAYQLLHVLLHELGHHHDRMTTKSKRRSCRGEDYAEQYALRHEKLIWNRYLNEFGLP